MIINMKLKIIHVRKVFSTHFTYFMSMDGFYMIPQRIFTSIDFVTLITIVLNIVMCPLDMTVQINLPRKGFVTLFTIVSNILMNTFNVLVQMGLL